MDSIAPASYSHELPLSVASSGTGLQHRLGPLAYRSHANNDTPLGPRRIIVG